MSGATYQTLEPMVLATMRHVGPHDPALTSSTWSDLIVWASPRRLLGRRMDVRGVGLLWDHPDLYEREQRRYDVGIPVDFEDVPDITEPAVVLVTLPGRYLRYRHEGSYDNLLHAYRSALDSFRYESVELVAAPIIEVYRNSPSDVAEDELLTDLYFPVVEL